MKFIDKIRQASKEALEDMKWPFRMKTIERAADSFSDSLSMKRIEAEQLIMDKRLALTKAKDEAEAKKLWAEIAEAKLDLIETERIAKVIAEEREALFAEVKE